VRVDSASSRTWMLATLAGWALLVWLLALFGMGGNITPLPDDATLAQRLPTPPKPPAERIGTLAQYGETGTRPLFSEDRRPQPFSLQPEGEVPQEPSFDFILTSVLQAPGLQMAIVQPTEGGDSVRMKLGEAPEEAKGWRLVELHPRSAVFDGPEGQKSLDLRTFDGNGGEAPTAMTRAPGDAGRPAGDTANPTRALPPPGKPQPAPPADVAPPRPVARPANTPAITPETTTAGQPAITPEAQMEAIRKRIEARRAQLRAQAQQLAPQEQPAQKPQP
jgi:general secretion pathway protein N